MPTKIDIPATVRASVLEQLAAGLAYEVIAANHAMNHHLVRRIAREAGVVKQPAPNNPVSELKREMVARLMRLGVGNCEIAKRVKCSARVVREMRANVEVARG
jgi:hypothetical protein